MNRRDVILRDLYNTSPYKIGEMVRPTNDDDYKNNGLYYVKNIDSSWFQYKGIIINENDVEWPKNDNPRVVLAICQRDGKPCTATVNYFIPSTFKKTT